MKLLAAAVKDTALAVFHPPFFVRHTGEAVRAFTAEVNRQDAKQSPVSMHAKDFELWIVGMFDDELGLFVSGAEVRRIATGVDVRLTE